MPEVTIVLTDTPSGAVAIKHNFVPRAGNPCSPAQAAALEIINRTTREWGVKQPPLLAEVDIDAVHRRRDGIVAQAGGKRA